MDVLSEAFYERCYRCRAVVPNGLVKRRTVNTGHSLGVHRCEHYEIVSMCGVCYQIFEDEGWARSAYQCKVWAWLTGLLLLTVMLPFPVSLLIMCVLAWGIHRVNKKYQRRLVRSTI